MEDTVVPEVPEVDVSGPESEWKDGSYAGYDCTYKTVSDKLGENVVTKRGNRYAREGDHIVYGLDEAPSGHGSQTVARIVRKDDSNLSLTRKTQA